MKHAKIRHNHYTTQAKINTRHDYIDKSINCYSNQLSGIFVAAQMAINKIERFWKSGAMMNVVTNNVQWIGEK